MGILIVVEVMSAEWQRPYGSAYMLETRGKIMEMGSRSVAWITVFCSKAIGGGG